MKRVIASLMLSAAVVGCSQSVSPPTSNSSTPERATASANEPLPEGVQLVTVKLPEMTCGGCAAAVRSDLAALEGVSDVRTDLDSRTCQFKLAKSDLDLETKLAELAKVNDHFVGFQVVKK